MSITGPICTETSLVGRIVNTSVTATATTIYAEFEDKKTGDAREPQAGTLYFVLSKDTENFEIIKDPIGILKKLNGGTFNWKHGIQHTEVKAGKRDYGILADQVESVMPEIVTDSIELEGQSYKTVSYEKLVPVLIEAIKQQQIQIDELKQLMKVNK